MIGKTGERFFRSIFKKSRIRKHPCPDNCQMLQIVIKILNVRLQERLLLNLAIQILPVKIHKYLECQRIPKSSVSELGQI